MEDTLVKPGLMAYQFRVDVAAEEGLTPCYAVDAKI